MIKRINIKIIIPALVMVGGFSLYVGGISSYAVGLADSDGFITTGYQLGLMQPPGYGLYIWLLYFFTHLPVLATIAYKAHLLSAILHSMVLGLVTKIVMEWSERVDWGKKPNNYQVILAGLFGAVYLGTNYLFWQNSLIAEKYPLNNILSLMMLWLLTKTDKNLVQKKKSILVGIVMGGLFFYHQLGWLMIPILIGHAWLNRGWWRKNVLKVGLCFLISISINVGLTFRLNQLVRPVNWHFENSIKGFYHQIMRTEISGIDDNSGVKRSFFNLTDVLSNIRSDFKIWVNYLNQININGWWIWLGLGLGTVMIKFKHLRAKIWLFSWMIYMALVPFYQQWPSSIGSQAQVVRWILLGTVISAVIAGIGFNTLFSLFNKKWMMILGGILLTVGGGNRIFQSMHSMSLADYDEIENGYRKMMISLPVNSLLVCDSDVACFGSLYVQEVLSERKDVIVVPPAYPLVGDKLATFTLLHRFNYTNNPFLLLDYVSWNLDKRKVYAVDLSNTHQNLLGIKLGLTYLIPRGLVNEISLIPITSDKVNETYENFGTYQLLKKWDLGRRYHATNEGYNLTVQALAYARLREYSKADMVLLKANKFKLSAPVAYGEWIETVKKSVIEMKDMGEKYGSWTLEEKKKLVERDIIFNKYDRAYLTLMGLLVNYPMNVELRLKLADFYMLVGDVKMARMEYLNVLTIDFNNERAVKQLEYVNNLSISSNELQPNGYMVDGY